MHGLFIQQHQDADPMITKIKTACLSGSNNSDRQLIAFRGCTLVTYYKRVIVHATLRDDLMHWYYESLGLPASSRLYKTMHQILYCPSVRTTIVEYVKQCVICKPTKLMAASRIMVLLHLEIPRP